MGQDYFQFKQFRVSQDQSAMKVTTDACLFGAWISIPGSKNTELLDIGTGTGLLALMVAQNHPGIKIDAIEIDEMAYMQARENFSNSPWAAQLRVLQGDVRNPSLNKNYPVIISNPPFYEKELPGTKKEKNIAHHNEGLLLSELFQFIKDHLEPHGEFFVLLPFKRNEEIIRLLDTHSLTSVETVFVRQTVNHSYFRMMIKGKLKNEEDGETKVSELAIKDGNGNYTETFSDLLRNFYLYL